MEPETASDEQRRAGWRVRWLTAIQAFADTETQRQRWLDPAEANPHFSYVECMCVYFDDVLVGEAQPYLRRLEDGFVTVQEVAAVAEFHALARAHKCPTRDDWDDRAILTDAGWQAVAEAAQQAQARLLPMLSDPAEREALIHPEHWTDENGVFLSQRSGSAIVRLST